MAFTKSQQQGLIGAGVAFAVGSMVLQNTIDPLRRQPAIEPIKPGIGKNLGTAGLPFEYLLGAVSGFRQVIAGLLWVRTDSFFHSGNYDAILPMLRVITWLDPNWTDVYATGAWHLMYNFTDTDQRSDRRYLGPGMAFLDEGIANNSTIFDLYKEKGWNAFDKLKDYGIAVEALEAGSKADKNYDVTQLGHLLAHSYERAGRIKEAKEQWERNIAEHKARIAAKDVSTDVKLRNQSGLESSQKNLNHMTIREIVRVKNTQPPVDAQFTATITRLKPKVLEIKGNWNSVGVTGNAFDMGTVDKPGVGILNYGPVDGARIDMRLQDEGFKPVKQTTFSFEVDKNLTIMQEQASTRGGKEVGVGGVFQATGKAAGYTDRPSQNVGVYSFSDDELKKYGLGNVPLSKGLDKLSAHGRWQAVSLAYPLPWNAPRKAYTVEEVAEKFTQLRGDAAKREELDKKKFCVALKPAYVLGEFKREIDMSKDPGMYSFHADKYELILSFNPRTTSDFLQDRYGWNGEGLTDKKYLYKDPNQNGVRMIRCVIKLSREDILGEGKKVIVTK